VCWQKSHKAEYRDRQHFNIRKIQIYKEQAKTHAKEAIKTTPKNNSIKNIIIFIDRFFKWTLF